MIVLLGSPGVEGLGLYPLVVGRGAGNGRWGSDCSERGVCRGLDCASMAVYRPLLFYGFTPDWKDMKSSCYELGWLAVLLKQLLVHTAVFVL